MSATHGLASTYRSQRYACRCDECRSANARRTLAEKRQRADRLATDPSLAPHGVSHTYTNWGCRCAPCTEANSEVGRLRKARLRGAA